jgi:hypothetical protein
MSKNIDLISEIEDKIKTVRTRSLDLSFNELLDMYKDGELIIDPEYQRLFRWSEVQQSRFIESLLLEMPIPPIFVVEQEEGKYELIDGLQRVSSYIHFRGEHPDYQGEEEDSEKPRFLKLEGCDICESLNKLIYTSLPITLQIRLKRNFIRVEVLRKESDTRLRYHMFKRLNTGGSKLSDQEVRNCTIRLLSPEFNNFLIECSQYKPFTKCIARVSKDKIRQKYDQELVLRFFAIKNMQHKYVHDVGSYLTECMEYFSSAPDNFDYTKEKIIFHNTFDILAKTLGEKVFSSVVRNKKNLSSRFSTYHYEAMTLCIASHLDKLQGLTEDKFSLLKTILTKIKEDPDFIDMTTSGGKNYTTPFKKRIEFAEERIRNFCNGL